MPFGGGAEALMDEFWRFTDEPHLGSTDGNSKRPQ